MDNRGVLSSKCALHDTHSRRFGVPKRIAVARLVEPEVSPIAQTPFGIRAKLNEIE